MFAPEVEARFKRIEDAHAVTAELLHRFEMRTHERVGRLEAIQDAMAGWLNEIDLRINALVDAQLRTEQSVAELSRTVDRFLKSRSDGGAN